jgi:hypothetical protein
MIVCVRFMPFSLANSVDVLLTQMEGLCFETVPAEA